MCREEEKANTRILPKYNPWWLIEYKRNGLKIHDLSSIKVNDLKIIASEIELDFHREKMKKADLVQSITQHYRLHSMGGSNSQFHIPPSLYHKFYLDDNFRQPFILDTSSSHSSLPSCYPEIYEGTRNITLLTKRQKLIPPPSSN
jgi:hypothetical protein